MTRSQWELIYSASWLEVLAEVLFQFAVCAVACHLFCAPHIHVNDAGRKAAAAGFQWVLHGLREDLILTKIWLLTKAVADNTSISEYCYLQQER